MLIARRPHVAAPLCDLSVTESLRLRRGHGRAAYLFALFTERRIKHSAAPQPAEQTQARRSDARTLPS